MSKKPYEDDFKRMLVELNPSGISRKQVSQDYGITERTLGRWKKQYSNASGSFQGTEPPGEEQKRISNLEKELRDVKLEQDILKKAVGTFYFAL